MNIIEEIFKNETSSRRFGKYHFYVYFKSLLTNALKLVVKIKRVFWGQVVNKSATYSKSTDS